MWKYPFDYSSPGRNDGWKAFLLDFSSSVEYVTRQSIDLGDSQDHDAATKEELESLRSKVDELTDEVSPSLLSPVPNTDAAPDFKRGKLRSEIDQRTAEINTLQSLAKVPAPTQKNSGKPGQEVSCTLLLFQNGPLMQDFSHRVFTVWSKG